MLSILGWALWKAKTWKPGMFNKHSIYLHIYPMYKMAFFPMSTSSVIIWNQPNQCTIIGEIPQNYHNFVVFHQPIWKNISRQLESFPQVGGFLTWKNVWDHLLGIKFDSPQNGSQMSHWMTPRKFQEKRRLGYDAIPSHPPAFWSCEKSAAKHPTTFFINYFLTIPIGIFRIFSSSKRKHVGYNIRLKVCIINQDIDPIWSNDHLASGLPYHH